MSLEDEINKNITDIFSTTFVERNGRQVPSSENIKLGNDAVKLDATILYADMAESTKMVNNKSWQFSARAYKAYLISACKLIRHNGGSIVGFDGDRVMAIYIGNSKNTSAVKTALQINYAKILINEKIGSDFKLKQSCGIDSSDIRAIKTGTRGSNDLVWVGSAANYAAKLTELRNEDYSTWITKKVYDSIEKSVKYSNDKNMWDSRIWTAQENKSIYRSNYYWKFN